MKKQGFLLKIIFLISCFYFSHCTYAQELYNDVLYFKNGNIIRGIILEFIPNDHIKIETKDKNILFFKTDEVEKMVKEKNEKKKDGKPEDKFKQKGYFLMARLSKCAIRSDDDYLLAGIITGYQLNEYLSLGVGIETNSASSFPYQHESSEIIPVFIDSRIYIPKRRVHPMFYLDMGYSLLKQSNEYYQSISSISSDYKVEKGGIYSAFGAGVKIFFNRSLSLIADGGINIQSLNTNYISANYDNNTRSYIYSNQKQNYIYTSPRVNIGFAWNINTKKH